MRSVAHPERDHCHIRYSMRIRDVGRSARHPSSERSECRISDARSFVHTWYCLLGLSVVLAPSFTACTSNVASYAHTFAWISDSELLIFSIPRIPSMHHRSHIVLLGSDNIDTSDVVPLCSRIEQLFRLRYPCYVRRSLLPVALVSCFAGHDTGVLRVA